MSDIWKTLKVALFMISYFSFALQCKSMWMRSNLGLKL